MFDSIINDFFFRVVQSNRKMDDHKTILPGYQWSNNRTNDRLQVCILYFYYPGSRISFNTNNVYWLLTWFTTLCTIKIAICWGCKQEARLASIQILIKLETNAFMAWAVKNCFMSMISFMTGTCEPYACYLDQ